MNDGKKILRKTFWKNGCCYTDPTEAEFALAVEQGYLFPVTPQRNRDALLQELFELLPQIDPADVANAFLYSLSTRELASRSALGSYYFAKAIPAHRGPERGICPVCGWEFWSDLTELYPKWTEENFSSFERHHFGGRRHNQLGYVVFDLREFLKLPRRTPTGADREILRGILETAAELDPHQQAGAYCRLLGRKKLLPANAGELAVLLDILGLCGILSTEEHPCPEVDFRGYLGIDPPQPHSDIPYPLCFWRARDGIHRDRFRRVFGCFPEEL